MLHFYCSFWYYKQLIDGGRVEGFGGVEGEHDGPIENLAGLTESLRRQQGADGLVILSVILLPLKQEGGILIPNRILAS